MSTSGKAAPRSAEHPSRTTTARSARKDAAHPARERVGARATISAPASAPAGEEPIRSGREGRNAHRSRDRRAEREPRGSAAPRRVAVKRANLGPMGRLEDFIPYKLSVVANRVSQSIGRLFESRFNIQMTEWRIIMALYAYGDLVFNEVVERTSMDKARVSRAQRRLVDLGLIRTYGDPADRRKVILSLVPEGAHICETLLPEAVQREAWFLAVLDEHEHQQLDVILDKLMKRSQEL